MKPESLLTPEYEFYATVNGHNVFRKSVSRTHFYSVDERMSSDDQEAVISYMIKEGLIDEDEIWVFLT